MPASPPLPLSITIPPASPQALPPNKTVSLTKHGPRSAQIRVMEQEGNKRVQKAIVGSVRATDIEPYTALRWLGTLFKSAAVFLAIAVLGEFVAGLRFEGTRALPMLMGELARTVVFAVIMWGAGDLVRLLITVGNDIRAERILLARLVFRTPNPGKKDPIGDTPPEVLDPNYHADDDNAARDEFAIEAIEAKEAIDKIGGNES